jgi:hypothetical protein
MTTLASNGHARARSLKSELKGSNMMRRNSIFSLVISLVFGLVLAFAVIAKGSETQPVYGSAAAALSVLDHTPSVALPRVAQSLPISERPAGVSDRLFEGAWLTGQSRHLQSLESQREAALYVVPTARGWLCQILVVSSTIDAGSSPAAGGCVTDFSGATPIGLIVFDPDAVDAGRSFIVAGAVADDVRSVDIVVGGKAHQVTVRNNSYIYELSDSRAYPQEVAINYFDGTHQTLTVPDARSAVGTCAQEAC